MDPSSEILTNALELPEADRAELARRLLLSLDPAPFDPETDERWRAEIEARLTALDGGTAIVSDWQDAAAGIRKALDER